MSRNQVLKAVFTLLLATILVCAAIIVVSRTSKTQEVAIGAGDLVVDVPGYLKVEQEEPDIVLAYVAGSNLANVRFTVLSVAAGRQRTPDSGPTKARRVYRLEDKLVEEWTKPTTREGEPATMSYWEVHFGHSLVVISCYVSDSNRSHPTSLKVLASMPDIIRSLRRRDEAN